jgi:hypothetical protein
MWNQSTRPVRESRGANSDDSLSMEPRGGASGEADDYYDASGMFKYTPQEKVAHFCFPIEFEIVGRSGSSLT